MIVHVSFILHADAQGAFTVEKSVFDACRTFSVGALFVAVPTPLHILVLFFFFLFA
jgi:hypothetical protein